MRILHLVHELNRLSAGVGTAAIDLHRALLNDGVESYISGFEGPGSEDLLADINRDSYCTHPAPELLRRYGPTRHVAKLIATQSPQVIHIHGLWQFSNLVGLFETRRRAVIVSPHGMLDSWAMKTPSIQKRLAWMFQDRPLLRRAGAIHCLTGAEVQDVQRLGLATPTPLIPNALVFGEGSAAREAPAEEKVMLFLGRMHPKKNLEGLVRAWRDAKSKKTLHGASWKLQIVGEGESTYVSRISALISRLGLEDHVTVVGPLYGPSKELALEQASAFILPSFSEGLPMAILEAWRRQCLVLMSDECNLTAAFQAGIATRTGTEVNDIAKAITTVFDFPDPELKRRCIAGFEYAKARYDWCKVVSEYKAMYTVAAGRG